MTLSDIRTLVLSWLDDPQAGYFTTPQVNVFINNAQRELQKRLLKAGQNYYTTFIQTTLVVNQRDYVLPLGMKKIHRLEIVQSGVAPNEATIPVVPITINQQDLIQSGAGTPRFYFLKGNRIVLWPAPDTPYPMRMIQSPLVTDLVLDTDVPNAPAEYHEWIALLAAEDGFIKDGRVPDLLEKKLTTYQTDLDRDSQERLLDYPRGVVETGDDSSSGYYW